MRKSLIMNPCIWNIIKRMQIGEKVMVTYEESIAIEEENAGNSNNIGNYVFAEHDQHQHEQRTPNHFICTA